MQRSTAHGDYAVTAQRDFQTAAERHAVQGGDHWFAHGIDVHEQPGAVPRVLSGRLGVTEHAGKPADVGAGREGARTIAGQYKALHGFVALEATDRRQDLIGYVRH